VPSWEPTRPHPTTMTFMPSACFQWRAVLEPPMMSAPDHHWKPGALGIELLLVPESLGLADLEDLGPTGRT